MLSKIRKAGQRHPNKPNAYQYEVLVHWKGYEDVTWEPLENIINDVPDMVEDFVIDRWGISAEQIHSCKHKGDTYYIDPKNATLQPHASQ